MFFFCRHLSFILFLDVRVFSSFMELYVVIFQFKMFLFFSHPHTHIAINWWPIWMTFWSHQIQHSEWKNSKINSKATWSKNGRPNSIKFGQQKNWANDSPNCMQKSSNTTTSSRSSRKTIPPKVHGKLAQMNVNIEWKQNKNKTIS